jgi:hypothetical protein
LKPVTAIENAMLAAGPLFVTAVCLLEKPVDIRTHIREISTAADRSAKLSSTVRRILAWYFWEGRTRTVKLEDHIVILEDPDCADDVALAAIANKIRLLALPGDEPGWKIFLLNPGKANKTGQSGSKPALSAFIIH